MWRFPRFRAAGYRQPPFQRMKSIAFRLSMTIRGLRTWDVAAEITGHSRIGTLCIRLAGIRWKQSSVTQQPMADRTPTIGADRD